MKLFTVVNSISNAMETVCILGSNSFIPVKHMIIRAKIDFVCNIYAKHSLWCLLESPRRGDSKEHPQDMLGAITLKNILINHCILSHCIAITA